METQQIQNGPNVVDIPQRSQSKGMVERLFNTVDIRINGKRPWDIQVHHEGLYQRLVAQGSLGFGESYMEGWWDCEQLDEAFFRLLRAEQDGRFHFISSFIFFMIFF